MPWTAPVNPVAGTVITVAYAVANILDPIRWLRLMTGNADPPGSAYAAISDATTAVSWKKIPTDAIAAGAVTDAKLADAKLSANGGLLANDLTVTRAQVGQPAVGALFLGVTGGAVYLLHDGGTIRLHGRPVVVEDALSVVGDIFAQRPAAPATGYVVLGSGGHALGWDGFRLLFDGNLVWHGGNDGAGSGLDADTVRALAPGNAAGQLPINNGALNATLNAALLNGASATAAKTPGAIPIADAAGTLDAWVTPSGLAGVPTGLVSGFAGGAAAIPTGWARYTAGDGRLLVGAGTFGGSDLTFTENTSYGANWTHAHSEPNHAHGSSALGISGAVSTASGGAIRVQVSGTGTDPFASPDGHGHANTFDLNGTTDAAAPTTNGTTLVLPMRALVWIVKS